MIKAIYNLETLVEVRIRDRQVCKDLVWQPFKKSFWGNIKEGFYSRYSLFSDTPLTAEQVQNGAFLDTKLIVENNVAYYKPNVSLLFINPESGQNVVFETYEEAEKWGEEIASRGIKEQLTVTKS